MVQNGITFNNVKTVGVKMSQWPVILKNQQGPDVDGGIINAVDIDWNGAYLESLNVYINTTGELLSQINLIHQTLENDISSINTTLNSKANISDIPSSIFELNGIESFAQTSWVLSQLQTYSRSAYDVYVENGGNLSQADWLLSLHGENGQNGKSAYEIARQYNYYSNEQEWLLSLKGEKGEKGDKGDTGPGINILGYYSSLEDLYNATSDTINGIGDSYNIDGIIYVYNDLYDPLVDQISEKWKPAGQFKGDKGDDGKSAYDVYVEVQQALGNTPLTQNEWLLSLKGEKGDDGKSAYDVYVEVQQALGNTPLSKSEWINSLNGQPIQYNAGSGIKIENNTISINPSTAWEIIN